MSTISFTIHPATNSAIYSNFFPILAPLLTDFAFRIIGLSDGLTVPFALAAGLSSLGESKLVVLGGVAELIAGAISMGVGGFCECKFLSTFSLFS